MKIIYEHWDGRVYARLEDGSLSADAPAGVHAERECRKIMFLLAEANHASAVAAHDEALRDEKQAREAVAFWEERVGLLNGDE